MMEQVVSGQVERVIPSRRCKGWGDALMLLLPLAFLATMLLLYPLFQVFEFDLDEGGEAMAALMVARGYRIYDEVWTDQPPLLTLFAAAVLRLSGPGIVALRVCNVLLSTVLMAAAMAFLRSNWGIWHAVAGAVLIFLLPYYTYLSGSFMFGLPVQTFAMLSLLALSIWRQNAHERWLVLSALGLGISVMIKLLSAILAPIFVVGLLLEAWNRRSSPPSWRTMIRPAWIWSAVFGAVVGVVVLWLIKPENLPQILNTHVEALGVETYASQTIFIHLRDAWPVLLLAGLGGISALVQRRWVALYPLVWALAAYVMLSLHSPVWYHHQLLVSLPAALLAAIAVGDAISLLPEVVRGHAFVSLRSAFVLSSLGGMAMVVALRAPVTPPIAYPETMYSEGTLEVPWPEQMFLTRMSNHAAQTRWVVTNLPMYTLRLGLNSPPDLAFISEKRFITGEVTEEQIIAAVEQYQPEQVLIGRRAFPRLSAYLKTDYRVLDVRGKRVLYLRKDLRGK